MGAVASVLSAWCSWVLVFYLIAQTLPLFTQMWMEMGFATAVMRFVKQWATCSWCFFIFQAKLVGFHMMNEIRYGGATYIPTGRGLPTQRRPFIAVGKMDAETGRLQNSEGLYLDYAVHTYYDGMKLLIGVLLVQYVGGFAGFFAWLFIGLTIFSWLYAPFLFNPYQFSRRYFREDLRNWCAFFFMDGSRHWTEWFNRTQLKPRRGFRQSVWDIKAFLALFALVISFSVLHAKYHIFWSLYFTPNADSLRVFAPYPPIFLSTLYCIVEVLLECCLLRTCKPHSSSVRALGGSVCEGSQGQEPEKAHGLRDSPGEVAAKIPLVISALLVVVLEVLEMIAPIYAMHREGWHKAFIAGIILKSVVFSLVLFMAEGVLKSRYFNRVGLLSKPVDVFVHANRLAKDIFVATFLFCTLSVGVLLNTLNEALCPTFNMHQLLVYRARPLRPDLA